MLIPSKIRAIRSEVWFAVVCVLLVAWELISFVRCASENQAIFNNCFARGPVGAAAHLWHFLKTHSESFFTAITALATIAIARFTQTLWRTSENQLKHGQEVERAYISCGGARESRLVSEDIVDGLAEVHEIMNRFQFHVNNYGKTPGRVFRIRCGFCEEDAIPDAVPTYRHDAYRHSPIDPGRRSLPIATFLVPTELKNPAVFGRVSYKTIFGSCFSSGFLYRIPGTGEVESIRPPNRAYIEEKTERDESGEAETNATQSTGLAQPP